MMQKTNFERRKLGNSSLEVSPIGVGVMQFAGGGGMFRFMFSKIPQSEKDKIVKLALDGGINWFDTAEYYGFGRSERTLRNALETNGVKDEDVLIATKWWPAPRTAKSITRTIGTRQKNLEGYTIDLHQVHWPISFSPPEAEMDAMADLVEQGKIRAVGVSNFSAEYTRRAHDALVRRGLGLASNQVPFSLINRKIETNGILDAANDLGVTIIAWSPVASGLLTGKFHQDPDVLRNTPVARRANLARQLKKTQPLIDAMDEMAKRHGVTITQVALNWTVNYHGETVVAIPGASNPQHSEESAGVMSFNLTDEEMARLDELTRQYR
jgi:aryl-alcohol dehydrogenase-like predicted oxidoreductase